MASRRGRGEGSIIQRHDHSTCPARIRVVDDDGVESWQRPAHRCKGRWAKVIDLGWNAGSRQRKTIYGATKAEVIEKADEFDGGPRSGYTVETWMTYWLENIAPGRCRPQTLIGYRSKINVYIIPLLGRHRLNELEAEHIEMAWQRMRKPCPRLNAETGECGHNPRHGLSESSIRQTHAILARGLEIAKRREHIHRNPAKQMDAPGTTTARRDRLTKAEAKLVLAEADKDPETTARWWCALQLGMRQGECLGLPWSMVDFDRNTITIARTLVKVDGGLAFGEPKSKKSKRDVPMTSQVRDRLFAQWNHYYVATGGKPDLTSPVWAQAHGGPIGHKSDYVRWTKLLARAGVKHVALHSARNTMSALLEEANVPPRLGTEITGHSDEKTLYGYQDDAGYERRAGVALAIEGAWDDD